MGLMAERAAGRMQARQNYRTMARMQRRRSAVQSSLGMREDFTRADTREEPDETTAATAPPGASEPEYVGELERLAELRERGIITDEEFEAKKKQILGI